MNGIQNGRRRDFEKSFPGCLGRMVNLFDLSAGVAGNRLLTDKSHSGGSPVSKSQQDATRMSPTGDRTEDKVLVSELRRSSSSRKSGGTPIKMLIAQEMSNEVEVEHSSPSVVAKLMGLDTLPRNQPDSASKRCHSRGYSWSHSGTPLRYWQQEDGLFDVETPREIHEYAEANEFKDVYEIWHQSQKAKYARNTSPEKGRYKETTNEKKMALVRQKFIEAKRLATDEKLRQSKQFQEALEVLSSNKDLFLKFLQEPNSMFSQHLCDVQSIPPLPETKRITVLRPSKMCDTNKFSGPGKKNEKWVNKSPQVDKSTSGLSSPAASWKTDENAVQPTRIVVLKPNPSKAHDINPLVSPPSSLPRTIHAEAYIHEPKDDDVAHGSREVAKEITRQMQENTSGHRRDETLLSSVFSNGYIGDESSFYKSENEYAADNLSDSEVMSPVSRHSWDYINRFESPYSMSSFSRASYSPESSVCREAKKRLSERWAMMASNGYCQEQRHVHRSSSTLGEMLALSDPKKSVRSEEEESSGKEQEDSNKDEGVNCPPGNLQRSKSLPVSSTMCGARLNLEIPDPGVVKTDGSKEVAKTRSTKSSFKGRVSSLFFSRSKKSSKEKSSAPQPRDESESARFSVNSPEKICDDRSQCVGGIGQEECLSPGSHGSLSRISSPNLINSGSKSGIINSKDCLSLMKIVSSGNTNENQDQPSPISVLEPLFKEDDHAAAPQSSGDTKLEPHGEELLYKSCLIDKSPPIGSIARTLSWDGSCTDTATSVPSKPSLTKRRAEEEEQELLFFVQMLLSLANLDGDAQSSSFLACFHSSESPLNPSLRDKYINPNEARRRQHSSTQKLVFDCVNTALVEIGRNVLDTGRRGAAPNGGSLTMVELVLARMKEWGSVDVSCMEEEGEGGEGNSLVVEGMVRKEVVGRGWGENLRLEMDNLGLEIEGRLMEELVEEAVLAMAGISI